LYIFVGDTIKVIIKYFSGIKKVQVLGIMDDAIHPNFKDFSEAINRWNSLIIFCAYIAASEKMRYYSLYHKDDV